MKLYEVLDSNSSKLGLNTLALKILHFDSQNFPVAQRRYNLATKFCNDFHEHDPNANSFICSYTLDFIVSVVTYLDSKLPCYQQVPYDILAEYAELTNKESITSLSKDEHD